MLPTTKSPSKRGLPRVPLAPTAFGTPANGTAPKGSQTDRGPRRPSRYGSTRGRRDSGSGTTGLGLGSRHLSNGTSASHFPKRGRRVHLHDSRVSLFRPRDAITLAPMDPVANTELQASEARMNEHLGAMQQHTLDEVKRMATGLRKSYDDLRSANKARTLEIQQVESELKVFDRMASADKTQDAHRISAAIGRATKRIEDTRARLEEHQRTSAMYKHMIDRLKGQIMEEELLVREMQHVTKGVDSEIDEAKVAAQAAKQERMASVTLVGDLKRALEAHRDEREKKMEQVEVSMEHQEVQRRILEDRERKRLNIPHLPRGDLDQEEEEHLKQLYLIRKIYGRMLLRKLREEQKQCDTLEAAFLKIRQATGLTDVDDIVEKFMNRERAFQQLQLQQSNARERIDALRGEKATLTRALDVVSTERGTGNENRVLYQKMDEYDRKLHEATRRCSESKGRFIKVSITLEETRACVEKLLRRVDPEAAAELSSVPGLISKDRMRASVTSLADKDFNTSITMESLEVALSKMENKLTALLSYLAAVFEREEQSLHRTSRGPGGHPSPGSVRSGAGVDGVEGGESSSRSAMLALSGKATERVFKKLMSVEPDTSETNIRVSVRAVSPIKGTRDIAESVESGDDRDNAKDITRLLSGVGVGSVVERDSLKRLSAMFAERKRKAVTGSPLRRK